MRGARITFEAGSDDSPEEVTGVVTDVTSEGQLVMRLDSGAELRLWAGEVRSLHRAQ